MPIVTAYSSANLDGTRLELVATLLVIVLLLGCVYLVGRRSAQRGSAPVLHSHLGQRMHGS